MARLYCVSYGQAQMKYKKLYHILFVAIEERIILPDVTLHTVLFISMSWITPPKL